MIFKRILFLFFLVSTISLQVVSQNNIDRIEPTNWWVGMKNPQVQLLIYGDKISDLHPSINYPGVTIQKVIKVENPNYLFVDLLISKTTQAGTVNINFLKEKAIVTTKKWELFSRESAADYVDGFTAADAIYLITPDRFANGDETNDSQANLKEKLNRSFKGGRHGGDIKGITDHLDYIKNLGFTAIWLNPLLENDMEEYSYHGYSTTDFYKVDSRFGSNDDYRNLAKACRKKGMKLIMDMIVNHCGSFHWWMNDLPTKDWINQWEEYTETNHRKTVLQDPYVSDLDKKIFTDGWFVPTMPDLNQRNDLMATYLIQNGIWWVEYLGLSGIRMDTYPYPDMDFMADWVAAMMNEYPNLNIVGEEWYAEPTIVSYWQDGKVNPNGYQSELKSLMDFPLNATLLKALKDKESWGAGWIKLYEMLAHDFLYPDPMNLVIFPDNHDMTRYFTQVNEDMDLWKQGIVYTLTMRGIPQVYYGTELLMTSPVDRDDGIIRSDFPGGWKGDSINVFKNIGLTDQQKKAKNFLANLLHWRQTATATHNGQLKHFVPQDGVYVYFRYNDDQKIMVVLNKNEVSQDGLYELDLARFSEMLNGETTGLDILSGRTFVMKDKIGLPAKSAMILELK